MAELAKSRVWILLDPYTFDWVRSNALIPITKMVMYDVPLWLFPYLTMTTYFAVVWIVIRIMAYISRWLAYGLILGVLTASFYAMHYVAFGGIWVMVGIMFIKGESERAQDPSPRKLREYYAVQNPRCMSSELNPTLILGLMLFLLPLAIPMENNVRDSIMVMGGVVVLLVSASTIPNTGGNSLMGNIPFLVLFVTIVVSFPFVTQFVREALRMLEYVPVQPVPTAQVGYRFENLLTSIWQRLDPMQGTQSQYSAFFTCTVGYLYFVYLSLDEMLGPGEMIKGAVTVGKNGKDGVEIVAGNYMSAWLFALLYETAYLWTMGSFHRVVAGLVGLLCGIGLWFGLGKKLWFGRGAVCATNERDLNGSVKFWIGEGPIGFRRALMIWCLALHTIVAAGTTFGSTFITDVILVVVAVSNERIACAIFGYVTGGLYYFMMAFTHEKPITKSPTAPTMVGAATSGGNCGPGHDPELSEPTLKEVQIPERRKTPTERSRPTSPRKSGIIQGGNCARITTSGGNCGPPTDFGTIERDGQKLEGVIYREIPPHLRKKGGTVIMARTFKPP